MRRSTIPLLFFVLMGANLMLPPLAAPAATTSSSRTLRDLALDCMGEGRTLLARLLWFKMDLFHEVLDEQGVESVRQRELLPLLRMVTYLDPHFEDAYDVIAYDLSRGWGRHADALEVVDQGLAYNPESQPLHMRRALLLLEAQRFVEAVPAAGRALQCSRDEMDALNGARLLYHGYAGLHDRPGQLHALRIWLDLRPDDPNAREYLRRLGAESP